MRKHCWLKLWLMYVASMARFLGELKEFPSSCGGSLAVSLTVSRSESQRWRSLNVTRTKITVLGFGKINPIPQN